MQQEDPLKWNLDHRGSFTWRKSRQYFAKGNYFKLEGKKCTFSHLIYPVPQPGGLGVHATIDLNGGCKFGPDVEWIPLEIESPDDIDMTVSDKSTLSFYEQIKSYWPDIRKEYLVADYCGIRPKLGHPALERGLPIDADFVIEGSASHGIDSFINLLGIESPGLTASMAIADYVAKMALQK
jgi:L-2-hydroxyglutarate oxidase LhgO